MKILILVFMFFIVGGLVIISNYDIGLHNPENIYAFSEKYVLWMDQVYLNIQNLFSVLVGSDWFSRKV